MAVLAWIPGLPLASFVLLILAGRRLGKASAWISVAALAGSCVLTFAIAPAALSPHAPAALRWAWLSASNPAWSVGLTVDGLSWMMLLVVTSIGTMIQVYSIGYMAEDPRFSRFFAYLSLFCASMLTLVLADHFVLLYAGWELVGLCSYLLISFWFEKPAAAAAGRKAFITTRIGDTGLLLGILLLAFTSGDLRFASLGALREQLLGHGQGWLLTWISTLVFLGAVGKSAQVPLHVWLPDAMEGPTPVSALIHAATMVAAGVYLVARTLPLFTPESLAIVLGIGLTTHLFAGTVALTQTDIKRVLAYSTLSQLGLMMTALGLAARELAMFHLFTHAFFKALLFLGAGSVIHATHQQDLAHLGGLFKKMPVTAATFLIASLAMSGVPGLSGFWSKDAILLEARHNAPWVFWLLLAGAVMTAAYIFRLYLRCFHGSAPHGELHAHESPPVMVVPLMVLAIGAAGAGLLGSPVGKHWLMRVLGAHDVHEGVEWSMVLVSTLIAAAGFGLAWARVRIGGPLYRLALNKYYVDELYGRIIIQPFFRATQALSRFDVDVVDGAVNGAGRIGWSLSALQDWFDRTVVDRAVNGTAQIVRAVGAFGRGLQTGWVSQYLLVIVGGVVMLSVWLRWF